MINKPSVLSPSALRPHIPSSSQPLRLILLGILAFLFIAPASAFSPSGPHLLSSQHSHIKPTCGHEGMVFGSGGAKWLSSCGIQQLGGLRRRAGVLNAGKPRSIVANAGFQVLGPWSASQRHLIGGGPARRAPPGLGSLCTKRLNGVGIRMSSSSVGAEGPGGEMFSSDLGFADLGLGESLVNILQKLNFASPTRIQAAAIPAIFEGQDVVMGAETGSGKTLAYGLPILDKLTGEGSPELDSKPEALILVPNQELARQVASVFAKLEGSADGKLSFPVSILAGASGLPREEQVAAFVATPSAILRYTEPYHLDQVTYVVVDEADMMLDGGFVSDVNKILDFLVPRISNTQKRKLEKAGKTLDEAELPRKPAQTVFAAATLPDWKGDKVKSVVRDLRKRFPDALHVSTQALHTQSCSAQHQWIDVGPGAESIEALEEVLDTHPEARTMVFTNTVASAKRAQLFLEERGRHALVIHKEIPATVRSEALEDFRQGNSKLLVCTDLAARGLDIPNVEHVVQLDFATNAVTHLHRVGRTARAGASGHVTNIIDDASREVAEAIRSEAGAGQALAPIFSRNRGFRRRLKRHGDGKATLD